jgi:regulator of sigma E protease
MVIVIVIIGISLLILIHEFGHFIVAKKMGLLVEEFGFGFPPRLFSWKRGETTYSLNWLPFGGFVKIYGEDPAPKPSVGTGQGPYFMFRMAFIATSC